MVLRNVCSFVMSTIIMYYKDEYLTKGEHVTAANDFAQMIVSRIQPVDHKIEAVKLHILLYLIQGFHLAVWEKTAFDDAIVAYPACPVIENVYCCHADNMMLSSMSDLRGNVRNLSENDHHVIDYVLANYSSRHTVFLMDYVKRSSTPWHTVVLNSGYHNDIPLEYLKQHFQKELEEINAGRDFVVRT